MTLRLGGNSATQGYTARARAAAEVFGPGVMLWLSSAGPQDAARYPDCVHLVRLDNWTVDITPAQYVANVTPQVVRWRNTPNVIYQMGNEPDIEANHKGEQVAQYAAAMKAAFPGVALGNPPLSVEQSMMVKADGCDVVLMHSYFERQHPESMTDGMFGRSYLYGMQIASGRPVYVGEFNVVQTNCPIDWPDRNKQAAAWLDQAERDGVAGVCFFILDGQGDWASFDVGDDAAREILSLRAPTPPPPPPPPENTVYTPSYDPRGYRPLDGRWQPFIAAHNPGEAAAICDATDNAARTINYDANAMIAQFCVETAIGTSRRWREAHAAAGIGIYSDGTPDVIWGPPPHGDVATGIRAQADLLTCYFGDDEEPFGTLAPHGFGGMRLHKTSLAGLDGVWAADKGYSAAIVGYLNTVLGGDAPAPTPTPAPSIGISGDRIATEALTQLNHERSGTYDTRNGDHPWYLWCESFVERVHEHCGLTVTTHLTAADAGRAMEAAGRLHRGDTNAPRGAVYFWDEGFWADGGHTAVSLGDGTFVGTVSPEGVGIRSGWQMRTGYMGWSWMPGVNEGVIAEETDVHTDGKFDAGRERRLWDGPKSKAQIKAVGSIDPNRAVDDRWIAELKAGRPLGFATSKEEPMPTGGVIRYFSSGFICWYPDGSTSVN